MAPKPLPPTPPRIPVAVQFREAIAKAEANGFSRPDMTLRLTLADESRLRRDRSVPTGDIRFRDGAMRFLDVPVVAGGVEVSTLQITES